MNKWRLWGDWKDNVLSYSFWVSLKRSKAYKELGLDRLIKADIMHLEGNFFSLEDDFIKLEPTVIKSVEGKNDWIDKLLKICGEEQKRLLSLENNGTIYEIVSQVAECVDCSTIVHMVDRILEPYVRNISEKNSIEYTEIASAMHPAKNTFLMSYRDELRSLKSSGIDGFVKKYKWVGVHFLDGQPLTREKVLLEIKATTGSKEKYHINNELPKKFSKLIKLGQELAFQRSNLVETVDRVLFNRSSDLKSLAKKLGITFGELKFLTYYEILKLRESESLPDDLRKRMGGCGIKLIGNKYTIIVGEELQKEIRKYINLIDLDVNKFRGSIAFKGCVRARVKVVREKADALNVMPGDILVASETTPDFIIAMRKAAAFVTDVGGITSHAAIIAREMKKPCIIGTKIATKVLKDGDLIEVDANVGIVKVLTRV
ncbi:MAG: PEP-utilizing enzyme [Candidatus Paceibacterota bacterium]|jgi:phosphohistidine swiveling domain-containing protein